MQNTFNMTAQRNDLAYTVFSPKIITVGGLKILGVYMERETFLRRIVARYRAALGGAPNEKQMTPLWRRGYEDCAATVAEIFFPGMTKQDLLRAVSQMRSS